MPGRGLTGSHFGVCTPGAAGGRLLTLIFPLAGGSGFWGREFPGSLELGSSVNVQPLGCAQCPAWSRGRGDTRGRRRQWQEGARSEIVKENSPGPAVRPPQGSPGFSPEAAPGSIRPSCPSCSVHSRACLLRGGGGGVCLAAGRPWGSSQCLWVGSSKAAPAWFQVPCCLWAGVCLLGTLRVFHSRWHSDKGGGTQVGGHAFAVWGAGSGTHSQS